MWIVKQANQQTNRKTPQRKRKQGKNKPTKMNRGSLRLPHDQ